MIAKCDNCALTSRAATGSTSFHYMSTQVTGIVGLASIPLNIDVYAIRFLLTPKAKSAQSQGQQSQDTPAPDGPDASDPDASGALKKGKFAYTVMCKTPPGCVAVEYLPYAVAQRQALGNRNAEIGIASFVDNAPLRHFEKEAFQRRFPVRTGVRGRP